MAVVAVFLASLPSAAAQGEPPEDVLPEVLFLKRDPNPSSGISIPPNVGDHALGTQRPTGTESQELAIAWSAGLVGGYTTFDYTAQRAFTINGTATVTAFLGCQGPAASPFQTTMRLTLNGGVIAGEGSLPITVDSCVPTAIRPLNMGAVLDREVRVAPDDELGLEFLVWMVNPTLAEEARYLYVLAESTTHPSRLELSVTDGWETEPEALPAGERDEGSAAVGRAQQAVGEALAAVPWAFLGAAVGGLLSVGLVSVAVVRRVKRVRTDPVRAALRGIGG